MIYERLTDDFCIVRYLFLEKRIDFYFESNYNKK
jgi:hypothetical protein